MATNYTNIIQLARTIQVFAKQEITRGTIIHPLVTDLIIPAGVPDWSQVPSYTDSTEVRDSRSLRNRFRDKNPAGSWSLPVYPRPSGALGTPPQERVLNLAAFGKETVNTSTSVVYTPANVDHISLSIFFKFQDMLFALTGATVNTLAISLTNKGAPVFTYSGGFMQQLWAGKDELEAAPIAATVVVHDASKFCVGMKVKVYDVSTLTWDDNTTGYTITAIDYATNTITTSPALTGTLAKDDVMQYFIVASPTEVGAPINARTGTLKFDTVATALNGLDFTLNNNISYLEDEISAVDNPTDYVATTRSIEADTKINVRTEDLKYFRKGQQQTSVALLMEVGDVATYKIKLAMAQAVGDVPSISGDLQKQLGIKFKGLASAALDDEVSLTYV